MSFSNDVKKELSLTVTDKDKQFTCLYGILLFCKLFSRDIINFQTESIGAAELFPKLIESVFSGNIKVNCEIIQRSKGNFLYSFIINDTKAIEKITAMYRIKPEKKEINLVNIVNNSIGVFTAGVFFVMRKCY